LTGGAHTLVIRAGKKWKRVRAGGSDA
jgi:hypothetical protein